MYFHLSLTGLFTADQKLAGQESIYTRQNPIGTRRGYECPEERDYYPYWHPTEWKDIAILTSDMSKCEYYKKHSFNVEPKGKMHITLFSTFVLYIFGDVQSHIQSLTSSPVMN